MATIVSERNGWFYLLSAIFLITGMLTMAAPVCAGKLNTEMVSLDTRSGVTQKFVCLTPETPLATLIVFSGGFGYIDIKGSGNNPKIGKGKSFLVKVRENFAKMGLVVAVIDAPSDHLKKGTSGHKKAPGMGLDWRLSDEHMQDIGAVLKYLKKAYSDLPIFMAGQSLGTLSVVTAAVKFNDSIDGMILTSSATKAKPPWKEKWPVYKDYPNAILDFKNLDKITVPVLVVAHEKDTCEPTPPDNADKLKSLFVNSADAQLLVYTEGSGKDGCHYEGYHSYNSIQGQVVNDIANFIKSHAH
jgi:hypothetical protein